MELFEERKKFRYLNLINYGYITENGTPVKCILCNEKRFQNRNFIYAKENIRVVTHFECYCVSCNKPMAKWSNGAWTILM
jgi:hypothetical protein